MSVGSVVQVTVDGVLRFGNAIVKILHIDGDNVTVMVGGRTYGHTLEQVTLV